MISDDEHEDVWTFLNADGKPVRVNVVVVEYPDQPERSAFVRGETDDGLAVMWTDGKYVREDGAVLTLPCD